MGHIFREFVHKIFTAIVGVAAGMGALWYSQEHHHNRWIMGAIAAGVTLVLSALFHPMLFAWRHRPRHPIAAESAPRELV